MNNSTESHTKDIVQRNNVLVVVTCRTCPSSNLLRENLNEINKVADNNKLLFVHLDYKTNNTDEMPVCNMEMDPWIIKQLPIKHFPTVILVSINDSTLREYSGTGSNNKYLASEITSWIASTLESIKAEESKPKNKDICLVLTLQSCKNSHTLLEKLPTIQWIVSTNNLHYHHENYMDQSSSRTVVTTLNQNKIGKSLKSIIKFFPVIMIIPYDAWVWDQITADRISIFGCERGKLIPTLNVTCTYDAIEEWIKSYQKVNTNDDQFISAIQEAKKYVSKYKIEKISAQIIKLKQQKKQLEHRINELEELESMLKTIQTCTNQGVKEFLEGADYGFNVKTTIF